MTDSSTHNRWTVIVGALIVQVILGTVYGFSVFVRPLELEFGWDRATTQWAFSLSGAADSGTLAVPARSAVVALARSTGSSMDLVPLAADPPGCRTSSRSRSSLARSFGVSV